MGPRPAEHGPSDPGGVDLYVGGVEHAVLHLLYSRFWHKVLFDLGYVSSEEPYRRLFNQGYIQAYAYTDARGVYVPAEEVTEVDGTYFYEGQDRSAASTGRWARACATRSPPTRCATPTARTRCGCTRCRWARWTCPGRGRPRTWSARSGSCNGCGATWSTRRPASCGSSDAELTEDDLRLLNRTIAGVHEDYVGLRFNTAAAKLIELNNHVTKVYSGTEATPRKLVEPLVLMLAPLCPHLAEELWSRLAHEDSLAHGPFPVADEQYLVDDTVEYPIQVNGKVRSRIVVAASAEQAEIRAAALADEKILALTGGAEPRKVVVVPGRLVNLVV